MTWAELAESLIRLPGCDHARVQRVYPGGAGLYDSLPATVAVYAIPNLDRDYWLLHVTAIAMDGQARCNLLAGFWGEAATVAAIMAATKAVYTFEGEE